MVAFPRQSHFALIFDHLEEHKTLCQHLIGLDAWIFGAAGLTIIIE